MSEFELTDEIRELPPADYYNILALSGGGYRGLFSALVLSDIERIIACPLGKKFSLLAGTSIGAIIAAALALGHPAARVAEVIRRHASEVFDARIRILGRPLGLRRPSGPFGGLLGSKFQLQALEKILHEVLGNDRDIKLSDVEMPLVVIAVCATTKTPAIFSNLPAGKYSIRGATLKDALLASCAAPSYFPAFDTDHRTFVDGGLVANAPDMLAVTEVIAGGIARLDRCRVLSIGTVSKDQAAVPSRIGSRGLAEWLFGDLVPLTLQAQERLTIYQAKVMLGANFLRIDALPSPDQAAVLELDNATEDASRTLSLLAHQTTGGDFPDRIVAWLRVRP